MDYWFDGLPMTILNGDPSGGEFWFDGLPVAGEPTDGGDVAFNALLITPG